MNLPSEIREAIARYHAEFRNPRLPVPEISSCYSLFPEDERVAGSKWPESWQHAGRPGVYMVFGREGELLYVGKDAQLGRRLGTYFQYADDRKCKIVNESSWLPYRPSYVFTVALGRTFEAPSLEEYLIVTVKPLLNRTWAGSGRAQSSPHGEVQRDSSAPRKS